MKSFIQTSDDPRTSGQMERMCRAQEKIAGVQERIAAALEKIARDGVNLTITAGGNDD